MRSDHTTLGLVRELGISGPLDGAFAVELLQRQIVSVDQLNQIASRAVETGSSVRQVAIEDSVVTETVIAQIDASMGGVPWTDLNNVRLDHDVLALIPGELARSARAASIAVTDDPTSRATVTVVMANTSNLPGRRSIEMHLAQNDMSVSFAAADPQLIDHIVKTRYQVDDEIETVEESVEETIDLDTDDSVGPAQQLFSQIIQSATSQGASDIHFEVAPRGRGMNVRLRVDGVPRNEMLIPETLRPAVMAVTKQRLDMDSTDLRRPQSGRHTLRIGGREVDLRGATLPTNRGEELVVRVLDRESGNLDLESTGISEYDVTRLRSVFQRSSGAIIVCGPTGSGKSSTIYSILRELTGGDRVIQTIEDPVERRLDGVTQTEINLELGINFSGLLKQVLRADPDVVVVGEIRDTETAEIAMQGAISGHLVLTTLHAKTAAAAPAQLRTRGVPAYLVADAVSAILSQRLGRKLCEHCKIPAPPDPRLLRSLRVSEEKIKQFVSRKDEFQFHDAREGGCAHCNQVGYNGRLAFAELLVIGEDEQDAIANRNVQSKDLRAIAVRSTNPTGPMRTLESDALSKAADGITSLREAARVVGV